MVLKCCFVFSAKSKGAETNQAAENDQKLRGFKNIKLYRHWILQKHKSMSKRGLDRELHCLSVFEVMTGSLCRNVSPSTGPTHSPAEQNSVQEKKCFEHPPAEFRG